MKISEKEFEEQMGWVEKIFRGLELIVVRLLVIWIVLEIVFGVVGGIIIGIHVKNAEKWEVTNGRSNSGYAELAMIPEISVSIESVYIRGIRDPEYCIETKAYDTLDDLYSILLYSDKSKRMEALDSIEEITGELPEIPGIDEVKNVEIANELPLNYEGVAKCYSHKRYIVQNEEGYRFVFFVQTC